MARRIWQRLDESGRSLPLLEQIDESSVLKLVEINVTKLAEIAAQDTPPEADVLRPVIDAAYEPPSRRASAADSAKRVSRQPASSATKSSRPGEPRSTARKPPSASPGAK